jgi:hypothetical protein
MSAEGQIARGRAGESTLQGPPSESLSQQYSLAKILGIWAAAALPMAALLPGSWLRWSQAGLTGP